MQISRNVQWGSFGPQHGVMMEIGNIAGNLRSHSESEWSCTVLVEIMACHTQVTMETKRLLSTVWSGGSPRLFFVGREGVHDHSLSNVTNLCQGIYETGLENILSCWIVVQCDIKLPYAHTFDFLPIGKHVNFDWILYSVLFFLFVMTML